jgi:predicted nucleic acid-binding protein
VLDASGGVDILQLTPEGRVLATVVRGQDDETEEQPELWTVEHFHVEVAKVFRRDTLAGVLNEQRAAELIDVLADWPLTVVSIAPLLQEAWQLRDNLTIHDTLYVVADRRLDGATLVSSDRRLPHAPGVNVPIITPEQLPQP